MVRRSYLGCIQAFHLTFPADRPPQSMSSWPSRVTRRLVTTMATRTSALRALTGSCVSGTHKNGKPQTRRFSFGLCPALRGAPAREPLHQRLFAFATAAACATRSLSLHSTLRRAPPAKPTQRVHLEPRQTSAGNFSWRKSKTVNASVLFVARTHPPATRSSTWLSREISGCSSDSVSVSVPAATRSPRVDGAPSPRGLRVILYRSGRPETRNPPKVFRTKNFTNTLCSGCLRRGVLPRQPYAQYSEENTDTRAVPVFLQCKYTRSARRASA